LGVIGLIVVVGIVGSLFGGGASDTADPKDERSVIVPTFTSTADVVEPQTDIPHPTQEQEIDQTQSTPQQMVEQQEPTVTPVPAPTATPLPPPTGPTVNTEANVREGPGTNFAVTDSISPGTAVELIDQNAAGDWYQLANGMWIAAFLVDQSPSDLPVTAVQAQPPGGQPEVQPTEFTDWSKTVRGYEFRSDCPCDSDTKNCGDFVGIDAQACYEKCMDERGKDIHGLDRDKDGSACEWKW
jgi:hypothetical protein